MTSRRPAVTAAGFFDGVHLGHRLVLRELRAAASQSGARAVALTFRNHPLSVLAPEKAPLLLSTPQDRVEMLREYGAGETLVLDFTPELAATPAEDFVSMLVARLGRIECVFCGAGWRFGAGGRGSAATLRAAGIEVRETPFAEYEGARISSTRIRAAVAAGDIPAAAAMLGRPFCVSGETRSGKGEGKALGFPTVNIVPDAGMCLPPCGVYAIEGGVANLGFAPTFGDRAWEEPVLEAHYFEAPPRLAAGERARVPLLRFLRPEKRFASAAELRAQIARDAAEARKPL